MLSSLDKIITHLYREFPSPPDCASMFAYANLASANDCIRCPEARGNTERVCGRSASRRAWSHHSYRGRGTCDGIDDGRSALAAASGFSDRPLLDKRGEDLGR